MFCIRSLKVGTMSLLAGIRGLGFTWYIVTKKMLLVLELLYSRTYLIKSETSHWFLQKKSWKFPSSIPTMLCYQTGNHMALSQALPRTCLVIIKRLLISSYLGVFFGITDKSWPIVFQYLFSKRPSGHRMETTRPHIPSPCRYAS